MTQVPNNVVKAAKANKYAAKKFNSYFHAVEPKIMAAQEKFAKEMNKQVQVAMKAFYKGENIKMSAADVKKMEAETKKMCAKLCKSGDKVVKAGFKKMSAGVVKAVKEAKQ